MKGEKKTWRYSDSDIWYVKLVTLNRISILHYNTVKNYKYLFRGRIS